MANPDIRLSQRDWEFLHEILENPPEPNDALKRLMALEKHDSGAQPQDDKVPSEMNKLKEENRQLRLELARLDSTIQHLFEELRRVRQRSTK